MRLEAMSELDQKLAKVLADTRDYPAVPPGCRYWNPRRARRAHGLTQKVEREYRSRARVKKEELVADKARAMAREQIKAQRAQRAQKQSVFSKVAATVKGRVGRWLGRQQQKKG